MRKILIVLGLLIFSIAPSYAQYWYILDKNENVVAVQNGEPKISQLEPQQLFAVQSATLIDLSKAEYKNKKIVEHIETTSEKDERIKKEKIAAEMLLITKKANLMAYQALIAEGITFKHITENDFK